MTWRRNLLSLVLAGGCIWCIGVVQQVHSEEKAGGKEDAAFVPVAPPPVLSAAQDSQMAELKKLVGQDKKEFKDISVRANVLAELFNVRQYIKGADWKSLAEGRELALQLVKAAKAKDDALVAKLAGQIEPMVKKTSGENKAKVEGNPPAYKPVGAVHPLMESQQEHFDEIKKLIADGKDYKGIESHAYVLAELCNVNSHQKDKADYAKWAQEARELSLSLVKAAQAKDNDKAKGLYRDIHAKCGECHDKYQ